MRIVADEQLPGVKEIFAGAGELILLRSEDIDANAVSRADALLVRSVTRVDESLLRDSEVRFVGTATSGIDHIDVAYLQSRGISLTDAKGSNAEAVADYCVSAIAHWLGAEREAGASDCAIGIVGLGETGGRLARRLLAMGFGVCGFDPLMESGSAADIPRCSWVELGKCRIVSLHVPLTETGPHPSRGMIDKEFLLTLPNDALLINSCRGGVVGEQDLQAVLANREDIAYVADVWDGEPEVDPALAALTLLATPHIAGYSLRGKYLATEKLWLGYCRHFNRVAGTDAAENELIELKTAATGPQLHWQVFREALPLESISEEFKAAVATGQSRRAFAGMRSRLLQRREFNEIELALESADAAVCRALRANGFRLKNRD